MVLARVANFFTNGSSTNNLVDNRSDDASTMQKIESAMVDTVDTVASAVEEEIDDEAARPPYLHVRMPSLDKMDLN
jgi:hypothetical protein